MLIDMMAQEDCVLLAVPHTVPVYCNALSMHCLGLSLSR